MISEAEYAEDRLRMGAKGHFHAGVWWQEPFPFYAKPMFEFRAFDPGSASPRWSRAPLGYSHWVRRVEHANRFVEFMLLEGEALQCFSLETLPSKKRNQVRKGLKSCDVRLLDAPADHLDEIREIYISQATRHLESYEAPDTSPRFYTEQRGAWERRERALFSCRGREVWGAFVDGRLAAFLVTIQVDGIRVIEKAKSRTEMLIHCPSDALYFSVLRFAATSGRCERVVNPGVRGGGLDRYKEQFLFRKVQVPVYTSRLGLLACRIRDSRATGVTRKLAPARGASESSRGPEAIHDTDAE